MSPIVMYTKPSCPYCHAAKNLLTQRRIPFEEVDISGRPEARALMIQRSGRTTVPQIFAGDRHLGGCDDLYELDARGELKEYSLHKA
jgi:glutaredoxin 3